MLELVDPPQDKEAWDKFLELGLPTKQTEVYRYVRLKELYRHAFSAPSSFTLPYQPQEGTLVFINGVYSEALSHVPKPIIALPLSKANRTYGSFLKPRLKKQLHEEQDPFSVLNRAYCAEGLFIYVPPKAICETPLRIVHLIEPSNTPMLLCPRLHVFAGQAASVNIHLVQTLHAPHVFVNTGMDFALEEGAGLELTTLADLSDDAHHFLSLRATCKKQSVLKTVSSTNGGATSREDYVVKLIGEHADASLEGVWGLNQARQHHVNVLMEHQEPHCTSLQKFKGTLFDHARSSFEGKIYVHKNAQKTDAYQMNHNLIFGEHASANSKPNLEIFADDVKASHGSTVGQLDEEHLFYFTTRGIPAQMARQLLVQGFSQEILDQIRDPLLKKQAIELLR